MIMKLFLGGLFGLILGMLTGWFAFESVGSGIGIGIAMAIGVNGVLFILANNNNR